MKDLLRQKGGVERKVRVGADLLFQIGTARPTQRMKPQEKREMSPLNAQPGREKNCCLRQRRGDASVTWRKGEHQRRGSWGGNQKWEKMNVTVTGTSRRERKEIQERC